MRFIINLLMSTITLVKFLILPGMVWVAAFLCAMAAFGSALMGLNPKTFVETKVMSAATNHDVARAVGMGLGILVTMDEQKFIKSSGVMALNWDGVRNINAFNAICVFA